MNWFLALENCALKRLLIYRDQAHDLIIKEVMLLALTLQLTVIQPMNGVLGIGKLCHEKAIAALTLSFTVITESILLP
jgi:hypothetical protein